MQGQEQDDKGQPSLKSPAEPAGIIVLLPFKIRSAVLGSEVVLQNTGKAHSEEICYCQSFSSLPSYALVSNTNPGTLEARRDGTPGDWDGRRSHGGVVDSGRGRLVGFSMDSRWSELNAGQRASKDEERRPLPALPAERGSSASFACALINTCSPCLVVRLGSSIRCRSSRQAVCDSAILRFCVSIFAMCSLHRAFSVRQWLLHAKF